jgi:hypothetical protein
MHTGFRFQAEPANNLARPAHALNSDVHNIDYTITAQAP